MDLFGYLLQQGEAMFHVNKTMLQLLQMIGMFGGFDHENPHELLWNFVDIYGSFVFKYISKESIWLRLFPFSETREATWFATLHHDSITSLEELKEALLERKLVNLRDNI